MNQALTRARSMEEVLAALAALRTEITGALEARFGPREWLVAPSVRALVRAAADDDARPGAETVSLGTVYFDGTYSPESWRPAADTVAEVGAAHGFDSLVIHQDSPEGISFTGQHLHGHTYRFGIGVTTVFSVRSGPAVWAGEPYAGAAQVRHG